MCYDKNHDGYFIYAGLRGESVSVAAGFGKGMVFT